MPNQKYKLADFALRIISLGPAVIYVADESTYGPVFLSPNTERELGYKPEEIIGDPDFWVSRIHPDDKERVFSELGALYETGHHVHEYRFLHKDGKYHWMHDELTLIRDEAGKPIEIIGYWQDIDDRKTVEEALIKAKEEAEQANEAKSQFLSRMTHELRTPLNAVLGFAQLLELDDDNPLSAMQKESVEQIMKGGWHLLDLVNDLLDLSSIESGKVELHSESVDLVDRIQDSIDVMQPLAQRRKITINSIVDECGCQYIQADPIRLKQVLLNLLSNAVKYNKQGGSITLSCEKTGADKVRVNIIDTGSGIPEEDIPTLFEPFSRLYLKTYAMQGTGIGLTIAKRLIELMEGRIGVTSELGKGSTFWFELQESTTPAQAISYATSDSEETSTLKEDVTNILYIEDSPSHIRLVEEIVDRMPGIRLSSANTPQLGLELAHAHLPDLIVLDICLPGMDGFEVLEKLLANPAVRDIPVIAVSANAMSKDVEKGLRAGFRRYLTKPINVVEFKKAIYELLQDSSV